MVMANFRKITTLFIFIVASVVSTFAAVLDLPDAPELYETRVLASEEYPVGGLIEVALNGVFIEEYSKQVVIREKKTALHVARYYEPYEQIYIYFPRDGHQPTTAEAVRYSCANVDNRENSPITDWYVRAFGGDTGVELSQGRAAPVPDPAPQLGFTAAVAVAPAHIITVAGASPPFDRNFWQVFRAIASNPVGRVLLYRILIEIRRQNAGVGCVENSVLLNDAFIQDRNNCRSISIHQGANAYDEGTHQILFTFDDTKEVNTVSINNNVNAIEIIRHPRSSDIGLFHEMLHWFHSLRDYKRYCLDGHGAYDRQEFANLITPAGAIINGVYQIGAMAYQIDIASHHYNGIAPADNGRRQVSARPWDGDYEEMRTILGVPVGYSAMHFKNGDDLSENLYRLSKANNIDRNIRFGHVALNPRGTDAGLIIGNHAYFEDQNVINNYIQSAQNNMINTYLPGNIFNRPGGTLTDPLNLVNQGLGGCRIK
jgi:hypothetical protein